MALELYRKKRDFAVTPEPAGRTAGGKKKKSELAFVIQKHQASHLHYDFRLELDGVLLSWAVPKGPSLDPKERRLAMHVEDHPVEYGSFEGVIPPNQYGSGTVLLWDRGTWTPAEIDPGAAYRKGKLRFRLDGEKLHGNWVLVRASGGKYAAKGNGWFLIKSDDEFARQGDEAHVEAMPLSVASGRSLEEITADRDREWHSDKSVAENTAAATLPSAARTKPATKKTPAAKPRSEASVTNPAPETAATNPPAETAATNRRTETAAKPRSAAGANARGALAARPRSTSTRTKPTPVAPAPESTRDRVAGVTLTHPEKLLFPESKLSKRDLAQYYVAVADWLLPHIEGRPLTLVRCPNGWSKPCFYQKHAHEHAAQGIEEIEIEESQGPAMYMMANSIEAVVGLLQQGVLEMHPWGSRYKNLEHPDILVFDFDPDDGLPWSDVVAAARLLKSLLDQLELTCFLKTTGGKGLHVVVPIRPKNEWDEIKGFAKALVEVMVKSFPARFTSSASKARRDGKIFLDYLRNSRGATAIAPYSVRAKAHAPVALPIAWEEVDTEVRFDHFNVLNVPARLQALGSGKDPWRSFATTRQTVTRAMMKKLGMS